MKKFLKLLGWCALGLILAGAWWAWSEIDPKNANIAGLFCLGGWIGYTILQETVVKPLRFSIWQLEQRIDRLTGKKSTPFDFD